MFFWSKAVSGIFKQRWKNCSYQRQDHCLDKINAFDIKSNTLWAMYQLWGKKTVGGSKVSEEQLRRERGRYLTHSRFTEETQPKPKDAPRGQINTAWAQKFECYVQENCGLPILLKKMYPFIHSLNCLSAVGSQGWCWSLSQCLGPKVGNTLDKWKLLTVQTCSCFQHIANFSVTTNSYTLLIIPWPAC